MALETVRVEQCTALYLSIRRLILPFRQHYYVADITASPPIADKVLQIPVDLDKTLEWWFVNAECDVHLVGND